MAEPLVLLAAGGTGGHLFPAEALAVALKARGLAVELATDERATQYGGEFPARATHIIPSAPIRGRDPLSLAKTGVALGTGEVDVKGVVEAARGTAVEWHIIEEESPEPDKNVPAGLAYLKSLAGGPRS